MHGGGFRKIAAIMGRTKGSVDGKSRVLGLQFHGGRTMDIDPSHPAVVKGRTVYRGRVVAPDHNVLKPGDNQRKLGRRVTKGKWKGFPIYSLTLQERATCPISCAVYTQCYGNGMPYAKRYRHGLALEADLAIELRYLSRRHPKGFVIRLHVLGEFYSRPYVDFWYDMLAQHPALHVFGYCARQMDDPIGRRIAEIRDRHWERFAIRTSGASAGPRTLVIDSADDAPDGALICPAQLSKTSSCGTCALCWSPAAAEKPICFLRH